MANLTNTLYLVNTIDDSDFYFTVANGIYVNSIPEDLLYNLSERALKGIWIAASNYNLMDAVAQTVYSVGKRNGWDIRRENWNVRK